MAAAAAPPPQMANQLQDIAGVSAVDGPSMQADITSQIAQISAARRIVQAVSSSYSPS
jgi:hypothetical protein